jgi:aspartyl-tRNA(Asn)/glutamyl-tRNA(Gln) amidotransferase subunit A
MGTSTENSAYRTTVNPWDHTRVPGGSSGGSATAVAGHLAPLSLGSDTGGSIRQPASLCGIVGFKPTYGRVSRYGLIAFASSLDQIGPFAHTVEDCALITEAICGHDPLESTSVPAAALSAQNLKNTPLKGARFAFPKEFLSDVIEDGVKASINAAIETLRRAGATVDEVSLPSIPLGVSTYYIIAPAEASSNLARFDGVRYGPRLEGAGHNGNTAETRGQLFGHEVKARIMIGTYALSSGYYDAFYLRAQKVRGLMADEITRTLGDYDAIIGPTSPCVAFPIGGYSGDPLALKLMDFCTIPANMGGFPALSLPCGLSEGLPVGLQLMGRVMEDEHLLSLSWAVEQELGVAPLKPNP